MLGIHLPRLPPIARGGRINLIANSRAAGGGAGVLPTGWSTGSLTNSSVTAVGVGTENGLPYLEVTVAATGAGGGRLSFGAPTIPNSAQMCLSLYAKLVSGSFTNFSVFIFRIVTLADGTVRSSTALGGVTTADLNTQRQFNQSVAGASSTSARCEVNWSNTGVGSVTLRLAVPQLELRVAPTPPIIQG